MFIINLINFAIDTIFPRKCCCCKNITADKIMLCNDCWQKIHFIDKPICQFCGVPMKASSSETIICGECFMHKPIFTKSRSVCVYDAIVKNMIIKLKHNDNLEIAKVISNLIFLKFKEDLLNENAIILIVPMSKKSLRKRKFNQSALIAKNIINLIKQDQLGNMLNSVAMKWFYGFTQNLPKYIPLAIVKTKETKKQSLLTREQRLKNLQGSFEVNKKHTNTLKYARKIIVIDDVYTTGATFNAIAKTIKKVNKNTDIVCISFSRAVLY